MHFVEAMLLVKEGYVSCVAVNAVTIPSVMDAPERARMRDGVCDMKMWIVLVAALATLMTAMNTAYAEDVVEMSTVAQRGNGDVVVDRAPNGVSGYSIMLDQGVEVHDVPFALYQYENGILSAVDLFGAADGDLHMFTLFSADQTRLEFLSFEDDDGDPIPVRVGRFIQTGIQACGDLNNDGLVDTNDIMESLRIVVGKVEATEAEVVIGDVVPDGVINVLDSILLFKSVVGRHTFTGCGLEAVEG